ncbi:hypothetical protein CBL_12909 [Carabus blaptoides fortunei]
MDPGNYWHTYPGAISGNEPPDGTGEKHHPRTDRQTDLRCNSTLRISSDARARRHDTTCARASETHDEKTRERRTECDDHIQDERVRVSKQLQCCQHETPRDDVTSASVKRAGALVYRAQGSIKMKGSRKKIQTHLF